MAFNGNNMTPIGGNARAGSSAPDRNAPMGWSYQSDSDTLEDMIATGYFDTFNAYLVAGQFIYLYATDGSRIVVVQTVDRNLKQVTLSADSFQTGDFAETEKIARRVQTTGLLSGGVISVADPGPPTLFIDIAAGSGAIVDFMDDLDPSISPANPELYEVSWDAFLNVEVPTLVGVVNFLIDRDGVLTQKLSTDLVTKDFRDNIIVGAAAINGGVVVALITSPLNLGYDGAQTSRDFIRDVIGPANISGNAFGAVGGNLQMNLVGGAVFLLSSNFRNDAEIPDELITPSQDPVSFIPLVRDSTGSAHVPFGPIIQDVPANNWDNGSGVVQNVGINNWSIQQLYITRDKIVLLAIGQEIFNSKGDALDALQLGNLNFTELTPLPESVLRYFLVVKGNAVDLADPNDAEFFEATSFRINGKGAASGNISGVTIPGGADTNVQYNDGGLFGGDANFTWDKGTQELTITGDLIVSQTINDIIFSSNLDGDVFIDSVEPAFGLNNIAIGQNTLIAITDNNCNDNVVIGVDAGANLATNSGDNVFIGSLAGNASTGTIQNVIIGKEAGSAGNLTTNGNVLIGFKTGLNIGGTSKRNSFIGRFAGQNFTLGDLNILIGHDTGNSLNSGTNNIIIGSDIDSPNASQSNYLNIGNLLKGDLANGLLQIGSGNAVPAMANVALSFTDAAIMALPIVSQTQLENFTDYPNFIAGSIWFNATTDRIEGIKDSAQAYFINTTNFTLP